MDKIKEFSAWFWDKIAPSQVQTPQVNADLYTSELSPDWAAKMQAVAAGEAQFKYVSKTSYLKPALIGAGLFFVALKLKWVKL